MAQTMLDRIRAKTGMRSGYTVLDKVTDARKKFVSMGAGGVSRAMTSGQRPFLNTLASIFPNLFGMFATAEKTGTPAAGTPAATGTPAAGAATWGVYDYSGYDPTPQFKAENRRPRRRGI